MEKIPRDFSPTIIIHQSFNCFIYWTSILIYAMQTTLSIKRRELNQMSDDNYIVFFDKSKSSLN